MSQMTNIFFLLYAGMMTENCDLKLNKWEHPRRENFFSVSALVEIWRNMPRAEL